MDTEENKQVFKISKIQNDDSHTLHEMESSQSKILSKQNDATS